MKKYIKNMLIIIKKGIFIEFIISSFYDYCVSLVHFILIKNIIKNYFEQCFDIEKMFVQRLYPM